MTGSESDRKAWLKGEISPEDLDRLMADNGQAEANAHHVQEFFRKYPLPQGSCLLVHGCGTCQMFDYLEPADLGDVKVTFADIGTGMLETARRRLKRFDDFSCEIIVDDIENTVVTESYDAVLLSMVLLHVDWKKCLVNVSNLNPARIYIIEQQQKQGTPVAGAKNRVLPPSIQKYAETASIHLVPRPDLEQFLADLGYGLAYVSETPVPDEKLMVGFVFVKKGQ